MAVIEDMFPSMTAAQRDLVEAARLLGRTFRERSAGFDAEARFPVENYRDLRKAGLHALNVPKRHGGLGAGYADYSLFSAELGRWCGATALTFNMHAATLLWSSLVVDDCDMPPGVRAEHEARRAAIYERVVRDGLIFAQPFSEPDSAAAAGKAPFGTSARRVEGGYRVRGRKHFASLAGFAGAYAVVCTEEAADGPHDVHDTMLLAVEAGSGGVEITGRWDVLGMRATDSRTLCFEEAFVPEENLLMPSGVYYQAAVRWPHMFLTLTPTYLGIAQAAFDFTVGYLRGDVEGAPPAGAARESPVKQMGVAEMRIKLEQAKSLWWRAIHEAHVDPSSDERLRAYCAQYTVMEHANDLCRLAIRTCGGRSIFRTFPIERLYRDSRCGSLMLPWTAEICLERLGRESLREPADG